MRGPDRAARLVPRHAWATALLATLDLPAAGVAEPAAPDSSAAARADSAVVQLKEVLVRGARPVATAGGSGAIEARLDSLRLGADPTMEQALRALPTVHLRTNSRGEAEVTVRGSESRQVAILLDGVPLTFAWDGRADVSVIPALAPQEVTLVRGLSSLLHGPNTLGGVVEFGTGAADPAAVRRGAQVLGGVDQVGGYRLGTSVTIPHRFSSSVLSTRAGVGFRDLPGQPLASGIVEPAPTDDDLRLNTDVREVNGFLSLRLDTDAGAYLSLAGGGYRAERGIAAQLGVTAARFWRYPHMARGIGVVSAGSGRHAMPWGGRGDLQVSGGLDRGRTEIDAYGARDYATVVAEEDGDDEVWTLRTVASQTLGGAGDLRLGFTYGDIRHDEILNGIANPYRQRLWSGAAQTHFVLPGPGAVRRFDVSLGATLDGADTPVTGNKPSFGDLDRWGTRLGVAAHLGGPATTVHASVSARARFPSLRELYSGALGSFEPNPDLKPEHLLAVESGVTARGVRGALQVVGFYHLLSDAVVRVRPPGQNFQRVNQEGIESVGGELLASHAFGVLELSGDLIAQSVEVLDPAAGLSRPENMPELMGGVRAQAPLGFAGLLAAGEVRYTGPQFAIDPETGAGAELPPAHRLDLELIRSWPLGDGGGSWFRAAEARAAFDNVTDAVQYDAFGLPEPGRTIRLEVRLH